MAEEWIEPWYRLTDEQQQSLLEEELKKELAEGHPLAGLPIRVVARRDDMDDVLVTLEGGENGRVAEVHLTWSGRRETDPRWPRAVIFESMGDWHSWSKDQGCDK